MRFQEKSLGIQADKAATKTFTRKYRTPGGYEGGSRQVKNAENVKYLTVILDKSSVKSSTREVPRDLLAVQGNHTGKMRPWATTHNVEKQGHYSFQVDVFSRILMEVNVFEDGLRYSLEAFPL